VKQETSEERLCLPIVSASLFLGLLFDSEIGGDMFLRNVDLCPYYTALEPEGWTDTSGRAADMLEV
jgi:hypothetical protein